MMTTRELLIVDIANLIETKNTLITRMKKDVSGIKKIEIEEVMVQISGDFKNLYLFDSPESALDREILADAVEDRLEWIIDNVYDRAISMAQDKIERMTNELKQDLINEKEEI